MNPDDKNIKFPEKHYVGFQTRPSRDELPLGFMTPDGTDDAAKKRKATVDSWSKGYGYDGKNEGALPPQTYDNKPMSGFKLGRNVRHSNGGWGQGNVKWRIEDPRGFELEITSPNLAHILASTTVENGEILEQCMWARLRNENILVPVTTEVYKAAQANTARLAKSASMSDLKLGDTAILQNGQIGKYLGAYFLIYGGSYYGFDGLTIEKTKRHLFLLEEGARSYAAKDVAINILSVASPKLSEIKHCQTPWTSLQAETEVMKLLNGELTFESAGSSYGTKPVAVTTKGGKAGLSSFKILFEDADVADFLVNHDPGISLELEYGNEWGFVKSHAFTHISRYGHIPHIAAQMSVFNKPHFDQTGELLQKVDERRGYGWGRTVTERRVVSIPQADWPGLKVRKVRIDGITALGQKVSFYV